MTFKAEFSGFSYSSVRTPQSQTDPADPNSSRTLVSGNHQFNFSQKPPQTREHSSRNSRAVMVARKFLKPTPGIGERTADLRLAQQTAPTELRRTEAHYGRLRPTPIPLTCSLLLNVYLGHWLAMNINLSAGHHPKRSREKTGMLCVRPDWESRTFG